MLVLLVFLFLVTDPAIEGFRLIVLRRKFCRWPGTCQLRVTIPTAPLGYDVLPIVQQHTNEDSTNSQLKRVEKRGKLSPPLDRLIGFNAATNAVVYEVSLGKRQLGFEIMDCASGSRSVAVVANVQNGSQAYLQGVQAGDRIVATSATAGSSLWTHNSVESVRSAVTTRFVLYNNIKLRLERRLNAMDPEVLPYLQVPEYFKVRLKPPIGLKVTDQSESNPSPGVFVEAINPDHSAGMMKSIHVGDQIVSLSASWGNRLWDVSSVEAFMTAISVRRGGEVLTLGTKRMVPLLNLVKPTRPLSNGAKLTENKLEPRQYESTRAATATSPGSYARYTEQSLIRRIDSVRNATVVKQLINDIVSLHKLGQRDPQASTVPQISAYHANKLMSIALKLELAADAVKLFEALFGFNYTDHQPLKRTLKLFKADAEDSLPQLKASTFDAAKVPARAIFLPANNFVCTTAVKAYGRLNQCDKAAALLPWFESTTQTRADIYFMSALLYVCAKHKRVPLAEQIFWEDIPARELQYTSATVNSLMYMYAILNQPEEALKTYELMRSKQIECTVVTYGVLIKALISSSNTSLHAKAHEIFRALPALGIQPGTAVYNQLLEHYGRTHNFRQTKAVLKLMSAARPRVKPDVVTYGHVIHCFAHSKKPKSALRAFEQMRAQHITPNGYTYMGVLRALAHMRDAFSAVQVIHQMQREGITLPDKNHYSMAMFACVNGGGNTFTLNNAPAKASSTNTTATNSANSAADMSDVTDTSVDAQQCQLAESLVSMYLRQGGTLDAVICTLWLRALLQQGKWVEGYELIRLMRTSSSSGGAFPRPNSQTYACLLQYQILAQRWEEGAETMSIILSRPLSPRALQHTSTALAYCLGCYSAEVCDRFREDYIVSQKYAQVRSERGFKSASVARDGTSGRVTKELAITARNILGTPQQFVPKPTAASLTFAVQALRQMRAATNISLSGKFCTELRTALIGEKLMQFADDILV